MNNNMRLLFSKTSGKVSRLLTDVTRLVSSKAFIFDKQFDGFPKETDLKLVEEQLPPLKDGG